MFNLPEHFDDQLSYTFSKSVNYWMNKKKVKKYEIEHLVYSFLVERLDSAIKLFEHFNIDYNEIIKDIESGEFFKIESNIDNNGGYEDNIFSQSFIQVATEAFVSVSASNPLATIISSDNMFLTMCTSDKCKLHTYLDRLGISNDLITTFLFGLDGSDISDALDNLINKNDDIFGSSSGDSGTDTLDPNPNGKKHKPERINNNTTNDRSVINLFASNMIDDVKSGKIGKVIGREKEIDIVEEILCRKTKRNVLLLGDPGVGKTSIAEGLARDMYEGKVPLPLRNKRLFNFNTSSIVAGTRYRGDFEERMKALMDELTKSQDVILFIDEFHTIIGAGGNIGGQDMSNILKPALARGDLQVIAATTQDEYQKYIMKDGALERRFQTLQVDEPDDNDTKAILNGLKDSFEEYHMVNYTNEAIEAAVRFSRQYIPTRFAPDKDIDLIDIAGAKSKMRTKEFPEDIKLLQKELDRIKRLKDEAASKGNLLVSRKYKDKEIELVNAIKDKEDRYLDRIRSDRVTITENEIAEVVSRITNIPVSKLTQSDADKLLNLESVVHKRLVGQDKAVSSLCKCIRRNMSGLRDPKKPIGTFLFMGPTGVGKTELARIIANEVFGKESCLIKLNMSEYNERYDISKLIGAAPGYIGFEDGGKLTEAVRKNPYSVVLLDEIEKAHKDIYNIFLQVLDDGEILDGKGRKTYFNNCIIIMTSNIGAEKAYGNNTMGFDKSSSIDEKEKIEFERINSIMKKECENYFSPEFLNRLDDIITFERLTHDQLYKIIDLLIDKLNKRIDHKNITITLTDNMKDKVIEKGYNPKYGARPINRAINELIGDYLSIRLLKNEIVDGMTVEMDYDKDKDEVTHKIIK